MQLGLVAGMGLLVNFFVKAQKESEDAMPIIVRCDRCKKQIAPPDAYKLSFSKLLSLEWVCDMELCPDCVCGILRYIDPYKNVTIIMGDRD